MTFTHESAIEALQDLAEEWPDGLMLIAAGGQLFVIPSADYDPEAVPEDKATYVDIPADGGDPVWVRHKPDHG